MRPTPTLTTARLVLRPLREDDAPAVQRILSEPRFARFTLSFPHPYPPGGALAWIRGELDRVRQGTSHPFAITLPGGDLIGFIGISPHEDSPDAHIGYWIDHHHWNRGYATEAARAVIAFGFGHLGLARIEGKCFADNAASGRVLQNAGMTLETVFPQGFRDQAGTPRDGELYSITAPPAPGEPRPT